MYFKVKETNMGTTTTANDSLQAAEAECAEGSTAPRVSLADIERRIIEKYFITGDQIVSLAGSKGGAAGNPEVLTIVLCIVDNGFTVIGKAAPASPDNFDPELGRKLAYEDAIRQLWPLMGFELKSKLATEE
jgi:hypothetical protein